jgi:hypothetical protein
MGLVKRKKSNSLEYALATRSTKLHKSDDLKFIQLCEGLKKSPAEVLRQLVSEALIHQEVRGRDSEADNGVNRRVFDDVLHEHLQPVRQELGDVKGCLRELASMFSDLQNLPAAKPAEEPALNEALTNIDQNLTSIYEQIAASFASFVETARSIERKQDRAEARGQAWAHATYALTGNIFAWNWTILDWLKRYVVIPQIAVMDPQANATLVVEAEIKSIASQARKKRDRIQRRLELPKDEKVEFLSDPQV